LVKQVFNSSKETLGAMLSSSQGLFLCLAKLFSWCLSLFEVFIGGESAFSGDDVLVSGGHGGFTGGKAYFTGGHNPITGERVIHKKTRTVKLRKTFTPAF
jgi:hypothetical protein